MTQRQVSLIGHRHQQAVDIGDRKQTRLSH